MAGGVEWTLHPSSDGLGSLLPQPQLSSWRREGTLNKEVCMSRFPPAASAFLAEGYLGTHTHDLLRHGD